MDIMLWILIGLAAGMATSVVIPDVRLRRSASQSSWRRIRCAVAGMIGGVGVASTYARLDLSASADSLTMILMALAGALWVTGIVEAFASRRRRGEDQVAPRSESGRAVSAIDMPAYDATREALVNGLIEDAASHEAGRYAEIGRLFPSVRDRMSHGGSPWNSRLQLALRFWRGWTRARDDRWHPDELADPVAVADWPRLARTIASDLALDRDTVDPAIVARFAFVTPLPAADASVSSRGTPEQSRGR